jgi:heat shock protein HslJ
MRHPRLAGCPRRWILIGLLGVIAGVLAWSDMRSAFADSEFPFNHELLLEARPMAGSKRVPSLDIAANGAAEIDLWCDTVRGQLVVARDTITILTGPKTERQCPPDRVQGDEEMLSTLAEVTNWRREGDVLILIGPRTVRFRLQTN